MLRAPCQQFATARIQHKLIIIQQQRAPFTRDRHLRERIICTCANEGVTVSLSRMGTSQINFHVRRHCDVTFVRAETSRCHFHARGDIAMSLSLGIRDVTFMRDSQCHFCEGFAKLREYIANFFCILLYFKQSHLLHKNKALQKLIICGEAA